MGAAARPIEIYGGMKATDNFARANCFAFPGATNPAGVLFEKRITALLSIADKMTIYLAISTFDRDKSL
jgi:hypothetical protein